jgi:hypothetical protein
MPLPQVNDRLKEIPAQALRTVFATIGQLLLVADRFRARAAEQLSGSGESTATRPADQAPAEAPPVTPPAPRTAPAEEAESDRWRSLDKTGNVRLLDGDEEQGAEDLAASVTPSSAEPSSSEPVTPATPEAVPAPVEYTPTEPVPAVPVPAVPTPAEPQPAVPAPADLAVPQPADPAVLDAADLAVGEPQPADPAVPAPADLTTAEPAAAAGAALPVPNYDQLTVASLRARLRVLDAGGVQVLLDYEKAHEGRPAVITMFERRLTKLSEGS